MLKFSKLGEYQRDVSNAEIEEFNIQSTQRSIRYGLWTLIVSALTFIVSVAALIVALLK